jgi:hypothetical protein
MFPIILRIVKLKSKRCRQWLTVAATASLIGCVHTPAGRFQQAANRLGFVGTVIEGAGYTHRVYWNARALQTSSERLHLYIGGDGTPWLGTGRPARDPTPRDPLMLRLMARDTAPAVYLGRPCYAGEQHHENCSAWDWTHGRYSERVVNSLALAARRIIDQTNATDLMVIGYSGGGTLAMLLADRLDMVTDVVTVAGNLDVDAWTRLHGYSELSGSLDPAKRGALPTRVRQWHWLGENDTNVPPELVISAIRSANHIRVQVLEGFDHRCCWEKQWPRLLERVARPR